MTKPILFSFFSGSGFLDLGFELNGFDIQFVNEHHKPFIEAYKYSRQKLGISSPKFGFDESDINDLIHGDKRSILSDIVLRARESGQVIGFIGGPPCPDFSVGGKNKGIEGDNGKLTKTYIEAIIDFSPDFFLFENVKGLWRTKRHRDFYESMKILLHNSGYCLVDRLTNAIEYGVPQDRDRIILFGIKKELIEENLYEKLNWESYIKYDLKKVISDNNWPDKTQYIENSDVKIPKEIYPYRELTVQYWFEKNNVNEHVNSSHHFIPRAALPKFKTIEEGDTGKKSFKRLHRWRYSPTAAYGNNEVHIHPYKSRRISAAEALAIQSLPKEFELPESMSLSNMFKTIGNGVPFLLSEGIAKMIHSFLYKNIIPTYGLAPDPVDS